MVEIVVKQNILAELVMNAEDVVALIENTIRDPLVQKITKAVNDMSFVDMNFNEEDKIFEIDASVIICSLQDIATTAELQAQKLAGYGLNEEQIFDVLSVGLNSHGGF